MHYRRNLRSGRHRHGFTFIELLVVVLILTILLAIALPLYLNAVGDAQTKACRANMQTIANTVQAARVKNMTPDYGPWIGHTIAELLASSPSLLPDLQVSPTCPNGAYFAIEQGSSGDNTTFRVKCCPTHGTYEPGVDSK